MNICELRLLNSSGVMIDRVDFMSSPFAAPFNFRIPRSEKRQLVVGDNMLDHGSAILESKYSNTVITLQPTLNVDCNTAEEALLKIRVWQTKIDRILQEARKFSTRQTYNTVVFVEDTKGFILVSDIIDGDFTVSDDPSWTHIGKGIVTSTDLSMVRKPFRRRDSTEIVDNYQLNPSFEVYYTFSEVCSSITYNSISYPGWNRTFTCANAVAVYKTSKDCVLGDNSAYFFGLSGGILLSTDQWLLETFLDRARTPSAGELFYAEAWGVCESESNPGNDHWYFGVSNNGTINKVYWNYGEVPTNKNPSWYRSRQDISEDLSSPSEYASSPKFIRKGFFFKTFGDVFDLRLIIGLGKDIANPSNPSDIKFKIDGVYCTKATNFLSASQYSALLSRVNLSGPINVEPGIRFSDSALLPSYWGSAGHINESYDHIDNGATNYLDYHGVLGDIPAEVEMTISQAGASPTRSLAITAGLSSRLTHWSTRNKLVRTSAGNIAPPELNGIDYISSLNGVQNDTNPTISSSSYVDLDSFTFENGVDLERIAGNYRVLLRATIFGAYLVDGIKFRYAIKSGPATIYGKEVSLPKLDPTVHAYVDLGAINIQDVENKGVTIYVQGRIRTGSQMIGMDSVFLIPADEWAFLIQTSVPLNSQYFLRAGNFSGLDDRVVMVSSNTSYPVEYVTGQKPYLAPNLDNRVYLAINTKQTPTGYFTNLKDHDSVSGPFVIVSTKIRERYL